MDRFEKAVFHLKKTLREKLQKKKCDFNGKPFLDEIIASFGFVDRTVIKTALAIKKKKEEKLIETLNSINAILESYCLHDFKNDTKKIDRIVNQMTDIIISTIVDDFNKPTLNELWAAYKKKENVATTRRKSSSASKRDSASKLDSASTGLTVGGKKKRTKKYKTKKNKTVK